MRAHAVVIGVAIVIGLMVVVGGPDLPAPAVWADEDGQATRRVFIVLDRGASARDKSPTDQGNALRMWKSLTARGVDCVLLAAGVDEDGAQVLDDAPPTAQGLTGLARRAEFDFRGGTDPRAALAHVLASGHKGPLEVVFLGPFGPAGEDAPSKATPKKSSAKKDTPGKKDAASSGKDDPDNGDAAKKDEPKKKAQETPKRVGRTKALAAWNAGAPADSRVLAVRTAPAALALLSGARGLVSEGRLVIGFARPEVATQPFSPLTSAEQGIEAKVGLLADVLALSAEPGTGPVLEARSDVAEDVVTPKTTAGMHTFVLRRRPQDGRTATLTFRATGEDGVHWLVDPPSPLTFRFDVLANEARLLNPDGSMAATFTAIDVAVGDPVSVALRLQRTRTGKPPTWRARAEEGSLPEGLSVTVGREVETSPELGESEVRIIFAAKPGAPVEARGTLMLEADGVDAPIGLAYEVRVRPGRATLEGEVVTAAIPAAAKEPRTKIRIKAGNENAPPTLNLRATYDGEPASGLSALVQAPDGSTTRWDLQKPLALALGAERTLAFEVDPGAEPAPQFPRRVTLALEPREGVELTGTLEVLVRLRAPRLLVEGEVPRFQLVAGALKAETPLVLKLDADGGDGAYLVGLQGQAPELRSRSGTIGWQAVERGAGVWHAVPTGEWSGSEPGLFQASEERVDVEVRWKAGATPGTLSVPVDIPARWGAKGFVILTLAGMALLLALLVVGYMRTPPVTGTLIYTIDGVEGTVGRLDLAAVGRKTRLLVPDDKGKLSVATQGPAIAKVRATRVGGMLDYVDATGAKQRRLLVDGLSLRLGSHLVRFVFGQNVANAPRPVDPAEDLLGPEFDIESGRIDAMPDGEPSDD